MTNREKRSINPLVPEYRLNKGVGRRPDILDTLTIRPRRFLIISKLNIVRMSKSIQKTKPGKTI